MRLKCLGPSVPQLLLVDLRQSSNTSTTSTSSTSTSNTSPSSPSFTVLHSLAQLAELVRSLALPRTITHTLPVSRLGSGSKQQVTSSK